MIQASGTLTGNVDWNNYMSPGVYKVQGTTMTAQYHAPVGMHRYGVLVVLVSEIVSERRRVQIYIPDLADGNTSDFIAAIRIYNEGWRKWRGVSGTLLE